ncbi:PilZ domain-containing protein [Ramlibacter tataouinensis]|uniref:PilZ domain-containing protein n=1 Tax=Ramlibacter tataouinensis TaxID=94132 RepID=UPI0022F37F40|nr:PilZ domain-containing protein [Ramlibacter tataouinensis]WBY01793.1 PilZ domain-containing protein [Ramlibacter tataouinensis]
MATGEPRVVVPLGRLQEKRGAERFEMELPLMLAQGQGGVTRDMSVSGLSFTSRQPHAAGDRIELTVEYLLDGHNYPLRCEVVVVRCEPCPGGFTTGVRLATAFVEEGPDGPTGAGA